jgi:hypothetical protein
MLVQPLHHYRSLPVLPLAALGLLQAKDNLVRKCLVVVADVRGVLATVTTACTKRAGAAASVELNVGDVSPTE